MRRVPLAVAFLLGSALWLPPSAGATEQDFYLHNSTAGVSIPGGSTHSYLNQTAPTSSTPIVAGPFSVNANATYTFDAFTGTALGSAVSLERLVTVILNLSANHVMNSCVGLNATLYRVSSSGVATALGDGSVTSISLPQGSGGGLVGYEPRSIPLEMSLDRDIPAGSTIKIVVSLTNSCASNASVRLIYDGTGTPPQDARSRVEFATPDVTIYGAHGTFGTMNGTLGGGLTIARVDVPNWGIDTGQTLFLSAVSPTDNTLFVENYGQGFDFPISSSCDTAITCFNPYAKTCPVGGLGSGLPNDNFSIIRVPDHNGDIYDPSNANPADCSSASPGSTDVSDIEVVRFAGDPGGERIMFDSSFSSNSLNNYPTLDGLGRVWDSSISDYKWTLNGPRYATDLQADPLGTQACPNGPLGKPRCGLVNELARLPVSGRVVMTHYLRGGTGTGSQANLSVVDSDGNLLAYRGEPVPQTDHDNCQSGGTPIGILTAARSVQADPTSVANDERFVVTYDNFGLNVAVGRSQTFQEFSYNDSTHTITPISAPLFVSSPATKSPQVPAAPCATASGSIQSLGSVFDTDGNLWIIRQGATIDVFRKSAGHRRTETDTACNYASNVGVWGITCRADAERTGFNDLAGGGVGVQDAAGTMIHTGYNGNVVRATLPASPSDDVTPKTTIINLSSSQLPLIAPNNGVGTFNTSDIDMQIQQGPVDSNHHVQWLPVATVFTSQYDPVNHPGGLLQQAVWLYAIDLDRSAAFP